MWKLEGKIGRNGNWIDDSMHMYEIAEKNEKPHHVGTTGVRENCNSVEGNAILDLIEKSTVQAADRA